MGWGKLYLDSKTCRKPRRKLFQSEANAIGKAETISQGKRIENVRLMLLRETF